MKIFLASIAAFVLMSSCGSKSSDDTSTAAAPTWATVEKALLDKCSACHATTGTTNYAICGNFRASEAAYKAAQACASTTDTPAARVALTSGSKKMPQTPATDVTAEEKTAIITFK